MGLRKLAKAKDGQLQELPPVQSLAMDIRVSQGISCSLGLGLGGAGCGVGDSGACPYQNFVTLSRISLISLPRYVCSEQNCQHQAWLYATGAGIMNENEM